MSKAEVVLISRQVKPGYMQEFEQAINAFVTLAAGFPGCIGTHVAPPDEDPEVEDHLHHVLLAFDSVESRQRWEGSRARAEGLASISRYVEGKEVVRAISGLAYWFQPALVSPGKKQPPRWKVAMVTWLGIFPSLIILFSLLGPFVSGWPLIPRLFVMSTLVVCLMTWVVAPRLTKLFTPWLYSQKT